MNEDTIMKLIDEAKKIALRNFCCSRNEFTVGAALMTTDGKIYTGFNIENDGIQCICAERTAFAKALTDGSKEFTCIAVEGKNLNDTQFSKCVPCGYCRQFINEYTTKDFMIYTYDDNEEKLYSYTVAELFPEDYKF